MQVTPEFVPQSERRRVVGLATRTTNADEADPSKARIGELWGRFTSQHWAERLGQGGAVGPTLAVYSAYERDVSGSYQILIGRELAGSSPAPAPLHVVAIPSGEYFVFGCCGPLPRAGIAGGQSAWHFVERAG